MKLYIFLSQKKVFLVSSGQNEIHHFWSPLEKSAIVLPWKKSFRRPSSWQQYPRCRSFTLLPLTVALFLPQLRADPTLPDAAGQTAITLAESNGHVQCARLLNTCRQTHNGSCDSLPQRCNGEPGGVRAHVKYMYTSAI